MTWQEKMDEKLVDVSNDLKDAIFFADGGKVWAKSDNFKVDKEELKNLQDRLDLPEDNHEPIYLHGSKFMCMTGYHNDESSAPGLKVIWGKRIGGEKDGVLCMKTKETYIACLYAAGAERKDLDIARDFGRFVIKEGY